MVKKANTKMSLSQFNEQVGGSAGRPALPSHSIGKDFGKSKGKGFRDMEQDASEANDWRGPGKGDDRGKGGFRGRRDEGPTRSDADDWLDKRTPGGGDRGGGDRGGGDRGGGDRDDRDRGGRFGGGRGGRVNDRDADAAAEKDGDWRAGMGRREDDGERGNERRFGGRGGGGGGGRGGDDDWRGGGGGGNGFRDRERERDEEPRQRPALNLKPRSKPVEGDDGQSANKYVPPAVRKAQNESGRGNEDDAKRRFDKDDFEDVREPNRRGETKKDDDDGFKEVKRGAAAAAATAGATKGKYVPPALAAQQRKEEEEKKKKAEAEEKARQEEEDKQKSAELALKAEKQKKKDQKEKEKREREQEQQARSESKKSQKPSKVQAPEEPPQNPDKESHSQERVDKFAAMCKEWVQDASIDMESCEEETLEILTSAEMQTIEPMRALLTNLIRWCRRKDDDEVFDKIAKFAPLLRCLISKAQVRRFKVKVLAEAQRILSDMGLPRLSPKTALIEAVFDGLYRARVIEEPYFEMWAVARDDAKGKDSAMFQLIFFLDWLKEAPIEGEETEDEEEEEAESESGSDDDIEANVPKRGQQKIR